MTPKVNAVQSGRATIRYAKILVEWIVEVVGDGEASFVDTELGPRVLHRNEPRDPFAPTA